MNKVLINGSETRWINGATIYRLQAQREKQNWFLNDNDSLNLYELNRPTGGQRQGVSGNFMSNPVTSWCNSQTAPPSNWEGFDDS